MRTGATAGLPSSAKRIPSFHHHRFKGCHRWLAQQCEADTELPSPSIIPPASAPGQRRPRNENHRSALNLWLSADKSPPMRRALLIAATIAAQLAAPGPFVAAQPAADPAPARSAAEQEAIDYFAARRLSGANYSFHLYASADEEDLCHVVNLKSLEELRIHHAQDRPPATTPRFDLSILVNFMNLRRLSLSGVAIADDDLAFVGRLPRLEELEIANCDISDAGLRHLRDLRTLTYLSFVGLEITGPGFTHLRNLDRLQTLVIYGEVTDEAAAVLPELDHLRSLKLYDAKFTDAGLQHLARCRKLTRLMLSRTPGITAAGFDALASANTIQTLCLYDNFTLEDADLAPVSRMTELRELDIGQTNLTDAGLAGLGHLPKLRRLGLSSSSITDAGLAHLRELKALENLSLDFTRHVTGAGFAHLAALPALKRLHLYQSPVTDEGLAQLAGAPALEYLNLNLTNVTDAGMVHLTRLPRLKELNLQNTAVTDEGLKALEPIKTLRATDFIGSPGVTSAGEARLTAAIPGLGIAIDAPP